jgi:hypothetical protein
MKNSHLFGNISAIKEPRNHDGQNNHDLTNIIEIDNMLEKIKQVQSPTNAWSQTSQQKMQLNKIEVVNSPTTKSNCLSNHISPSRKSGRVEESDQDLAGKGVSRNYSDSLKSRKPLNIQTSVDAFKMIEITRNETETRSKEKVANFFMESKNRLIVGGKTTDQKMSSRAQKKPGDSVERRTTKKPDNLMMLMGSQDFQKNYASGKDRFKEITRTQSRRRNEQEPTYATKAGQLRESYLQRGKESLKSDVQPFWEKESQIEAEIDRRVKLATRERDEVINQLRKEVEVKEQEISVIYCLTKFMKEILSEFGINLQSNPQLRRIIENLGSVDLRTSNQEMTKPKYTLANQRELLFTEKPSSTKAEQKTERNEKGALNCLTQQLRNRMESQDSKGHSSKLLRKDKAKDSKGLRKVAKWRGRKGK